MVKAKRNAAFQFEVRPKRTTENIEKTLAKVKASDTSTLPDAIGLCLVLVITLSIFLSIHWLKAAEAPAPIAIDKRDKNIRIGWIFSGDNTIPTNAVNITSDITLGFINRK